MHTITWLLDLGQVWFAALWILWLPGVLLGRWLGLAHIEDRLLRLAMQVALSLSFWPLLFLWTSVLGRRWSPEIAQGFILLIGLSGLVIWVFAQTGCWPLGPAEKVLPLRSRRAESPSRTVHLLFIFILILTAATRIMHIRHLALPAWVDSVHHTAIIRLLASLTVMPPLFHL